MENELLNPIDSDLIESYHVFVKAENGNPVLIGYVLGKDMDKAAKRAFKGSCRNFKSIGLRSAKHANKTPKHPIWEYKNRWKSTN